MEDYEPPTVYRRRYREPGEIAASDLQTAYQLAAGLVAEHGDQYLPLFERLDREMRAIAEKETTMRRALAIANGGKLTPEMP